MLGKKLQPTRDAALAESREEIVDLDAILSTKVTFRFKGRDREILPVTTQRLFQYVQAHIDYMNLEHKSVDESNAAFFKIIKSVCDDITLEDIRDMSTVQKGNLAEHLTRKITGQKPLAEDLKKKVKTSPDESR